MGARLTKRAETTAKPLRDPFGPSPLEHEKSPGFCAIDRELTVKHRFLTGNPTSEWAEEPSLTPVIH
jgi:hypothetical protein